MIFIIRLTIFNFFCRFFCYDSCTNIYNMKTIDFPIKIFFKKLLCFRKRVASENKTLNVVNII